jgi:hypothetical protein
VERNSRCSSSPLHRYVREQAGVLLHTGLVPVSTQQSKDSAFYWRMTPCTMINSY